MQPHDLEGMDVPSPARYQLLRECLRNVLSERRKWTAMPRLLDEVDACRRLLAQHAARQGTQPLR